MAKPKQQKKKPKRKPRARPTIVNKNIVNIRQDGQSGPSGARIPLQVFDRFDTSPAIEQKRDNTFDLIENQRKQLQLFQTDILAQQNANLKTLTDTWNNNVSLQFETFETKQDEKNYAVEDNLKMLTDTIDKNVENQKKDVGVLKQLAIEYLPKNKTNIFDDKPIEKSLMFDNENDYKKYGDIFPTTMKYFDNPMNDFKKKRVPKQPILQPTKEDINDTPSPIAGLPVIPTDTTTNDDTIFEDVEPEIKPEKVPIKKTVKIKEAGRIKEPSSKKKVFECEDCEFKAKSVQGLLAHKRGHVNEFMRSKGI